MSNNTYKEDWISFYNDILRKPIYWICIAFITILSYFFDLANRTIGPDDLARPFYIGNGKGAISDYRWGMTLIGNLLASSEFTPFVDKFLSVIFLVISAVLFSRVLYIYMNKFSINLLLPLLTLFSCLYISYPLINEIWLFTTSNLFVNFNAVIVAFCILILQYEERLFSSKTIYCSILLSIAVSSYESSGFLFVTIVMSLLLMDYIFFNKQSWIFKGIRFAIPLIIAVCLRFVISISLIHLMDLPKVQLAASGINWHFGEDLSGQISNLLLSTFIDYFLKGLIYLPITIFILGLATTSVSILILSIRRRKPLILLLYLLTVLSVFFQTLIQGQTMLYRTAQMLPYFCATAITFSIFAISQLNKRLFFSTSFILAAFLCYRQGVFLNKTLALNNQRSDNESALAYDIGIRIKQIDPQKPAYIVGEVDAGEFITRQKRPDKNTIGGYIYRKIAIHFNWDYDNTFIYSSGNNSVINWNRGVFIIKDKMKDYFSYYGFEINIKDFTSWKEHNTYVKMAVDLGMKPMEIRDLGDYILVYLGS